MTSSGTHSFELQNAEIIDEAFERCQIGVGSITPEHIRSAITSLNLMFRYWETKGIKQFKVIQTTQTLTASTATFTAPTSAHDILSAVLRRDNTDYPMYRISREEYLNLHNKADEGLPDRYFIDRLASGITWYLYLTPENSTDQIIYYYLQRMQDAGTMQNTPDIDPLWYEAVCAGLAGRLSTKYVKDAQLRRELKIEAVDAFDWARIENRDKADTEIVYSADGVNAERG